LLYLGAFSLWHTHGTFTTNSKNLYKNLKSKLKKLRELGAVTIEKFNNCFSNEWAQVMEDCSNIESQSWLSGDTDVKTRIKGNEAFWKEYLENSDAQRRVNIWLVKLNSHPISFMFTVDSGSCRYSISGQYNAQFKKYGVGLLADYEMLKIPFIWDSRRLISGWVKLSTKIVGAQNLDHNWLTIFIFVPVYLAI